MPRISSALLSSKHLKGIGSVAAEWSYVEMLVELLIWELLGMEQAQGTCVTTHIGSETRLHILETLASGLPEKTKEELRAIVADVRTLRTERNNVIHALWTSTSEIALEQPPVKRRVPESMKVTARGVLRVTSTPYPASKIEAIANQVSNLSDRMNSLINEMRGMKGFAKSFSALFADS